MNRRPIAYVIAHPIAARRVVRACRAPWPIIESDPTPAHGMVRPALRVVGE